MFSLEQFHFDPDELMHIASAVLALSLAFTVYGGVSQDAFVPLLVINVISVGLGVVLHELAHKYAAIHYGAFARFIAWPLGLVLMLLMAVFQFPILVGAPGAVYIFSPLSKKQNGIVSVVGPLTNLALSLLFAFLVLPFAIVAAGLPAIAAFLVTLAVNGARVNAMLAVFNMLPIAPLDGSKVLFWDPKAYTAVMVAAIALTAAWFIVLPGLFA